MLIIRVSFIELVSKLEKEDSSSYITPIVIFGRYAFDMTSTFVIKSQEIVNIHPKASYYKKMNFFKCTAC